MTDGQTDREAELVEEIRNLRSEMEALRKEVRSGDSRPAPKDAREAQKQAEEEGSLRKQGEAKALRAMNQETPNGRTEGGWL